MSKIQFMLNDELVTTFSEPTKRVLDVLREEFKMLGTKEGCGEGECGACSVIVNGKIVNSCLLPLGNIIGKEVYTIEGFSKTKQYKMIEECYEELGAVQCGFCTPGMIIATHALLSTNPKPNLEEIKIGLSGNLCRCTGYNNIIRAVQLVSKRGEGLW